MTFLLPSGIKGLKQTSGIFGNCICDFFNECADKGVFPSILKNANITFLKKVLEYQKTITDRLVYFQSSLKNLRNYYQNKSLYIWTNSFLNISVGLEKDIMRIVF